jgi:hypothetical protein
MYHDQLALFDIAPYTVQHQQTSDEESDDRQEREPAHFGCP